VTQPAVPGQLYRPYRPYPFSAIIGQEALKRALLLNVVDQAIGGALIRGERGTAKSTAVRALPALLPSIAVVQGCPYRCAPDDPPEACPWCAERTTAGEARHVAESAIPLVELPVAATEDRVAGSFDFEAAIGQGVRRFEPGLLAAANRGILYVDEVNLLPDHLIDATLDAAANGVHRVEREGVSATHPARFVLVGTMNPEEGELRPQLLDRFGLAADVTTPREPAERAAIVRRRVAFDAGPAAFTAGWEAEEARLRERIVRARALVPHVRVDDALLDLIARICVAYEVDGLRADIVIYRAAAAIAALESRGRAQPADVRAAAELALPHRRRRQPFDESGFDRTPLDELVAETLEQPEQSRSPQRGDRSRDGDGGERDVDGTPPPAAQDRPRLGDGDAGSIPEPQTYPSGATDVADAVGSTDAKGHHAADGGRRHEPDYVRVRADLAGSAPRMRQAAAPAPPRSRGRSGGGPAWGPYVRAALPRTLPAEIAFDATVRAAAPHQRSRQEASQKRRDGGDASASATGGAGAHMTDRRLRLAPSDLRERVREGRTGRLLLFVVDVSGSMGARRRMALARGTVRALLLDAYRARDLVGLIAFRGTLAELVLPPTNSVILADRRLAALPTGGRTPLAAALEFTATTLARHAATHKRAAAPLVVLISDGWANAGTGGDPWGDAVRAARRFRALNVPAFLIDTERAPFGVGLSAVLGEALGAQVLTLGAGGPETVVASLRVHEFQLAHRAKWL